MAPQHRTALLVATATQWFGTARIPRDLARAGWTVVLLAPRDSLAERSRYLLHVRHLPDSATPRQWVDAFAATVDAELPQLILPCDDTAFRLLHQLALAPPDGLAPSLHLRLARLIAASLGDPAHYRASVDKTLLSRAAEAIGVRVPSYAVVADVPAAAAFAAVHGWPVVLKRPHSSAGDGVAICDDEDSLAHDFHRLITGAPVRLDDAAAPRLLAQAYVSGRTQYYAGTTWRGSLLCGYAVDKLLGEPRGPASVVRYFHSAAMEDSACRLAAAFGATGIFAPEYILDEENNELYLVEINRRVTPGTHRGEGFNMSSGVALMAAINGSTPTVRMRLDADEQRVCVSFPHEWLRDTDSKYLRDYPVDVPWDEPELFAAMLALERPL